MSFKLLQFSPEMSTRTVRLRAIPDCWRNGEGLTRNTSFLRSWMEDESRPADGEKRSINWGALAGLAISLVISGGFWAGMGYLISRL